MPRVKIVLQRFVFFPAIKALYECYTENERYNGFILVNFLEFKSSTVQGKRAECPAFAITLEFRFVFILPVFHILFQRSWLTWRRLLYKWPVLVASGT